MKFTTLISALLLLGGLAALTPRAQAGGGVPLWTNRYNGPGNSDDAASALAVDGSGNVYVTGYSYGSTSGADYATVAYSAAGVPLWTNRFNGPGNWEDWAKAIAVDSNGNVFVTGHSSTINILPYNQVFATIKYASNGVPRWTNYYSGLGNNGTRANAIAVDGSGNVFVTGPADNDASQKDYATVKYSNAGSPLWTNCYNGPGNGDDNASAIAVGSNGNVFVTGSTMGQFTLFDYTTIAYSGAGVPLWTNNYNGSMNSLDQATAIALDGSNNVLVTGCAFGSASFGDFTTVKYSNAGVPLWINPYNGPGSAGDDFDSAMALAVDGGGNVFVTGNSGPIDAYDYATIAYSSAGTPLWTNRYNGPGNGNDYANAIAVDASGNVFVTGKSSGSGVGDDFATIAYSGGGVPLWTNRYHGTSNYNDVATAIAVDQSGNVFVAGYSVNHDGNNDYVVIKYSAIVLPLHLDFQMMDNQLVLSWTNAAFGLQSAPAVTGTFTNIPGATSPYTNLITGSQRYFRLKAD